MPPTIGKGAISVAFVCPSFVCLSVVYIANNSRTQRPSVSKFGRKVPHLRCNSNASFKVKRLKVRIGGGRGHTMSAEPGSHTTLNGEHHQQCIAEFYCTYCIVLLTFYTIITVL